jgi:hypothetical protein
VVATLYRYLDMQDHNCLFASRIDWGNTMQFQMSKEKIARIVTTMANLLEDLYLLPELQSYSRAMDSHRFCTCQNLLFLCKKLILKILYCIYSVIYQININIMFLRIKSNILLRSELTYKIYNSIIRLCNCSCM